MDAAKSSILAWPEYVITAGRACASAMCRESDGYLGVGEIEEFVGKIEESIREQLRNRRILLVHDDAGLTALAAWADVFVASLARLKEVLIPGIKNDPRNLNYRLEAIARMGNLWGYDQALRLGLM